MRHCVRLPMAPDRARRISRLASRFERTHAVRLTMLLVVAIGATVGFLTSAFLLWAGVWYMPVRYAVACALGYAAFVALMNRWLGVQAERDTGSNIVEHAVDTLDVTGPILRMPGRSGGGNSVPGGVFEGGRSGGAGASAAFGGPSAPPPIIVAPASHSSSSSSSSWMPDLDEDGLKLLPIFAVIAIIVGLFAAVSVIWSAPHLLAEILVDGAIAGGAYQRLKQTGWTGGIIRRTWKPMLAIFMAFVLLGFAGHYFNPAAASIGDFFQ